MRLLVSRGVVSVRPGPGGGLFVAEPSPTVRLGSAVLALRPGDVTVPHALAVRDALDPLVVDDAVRHASATDVADLTALLDEMRAATGEPEAFLDANWRLHLRMARISPNPILRSLYSGLMAVVRDRTGRITATGAGAAAHRRARYALHADLVAAIAAGDRARAGALAAAHHQPVGGVPGATARPGG
ncbi:MAG: FadR/GntR family transcriptional regulator [Mycobacteriales bacterium]